MTWFGTFYRSAIGKKAVMAVTGLIVFGWVFLHMLGNLKLYLGSEHMNEYGHWLRTIGAPGVPETGLLWMMRILLLVCIVLHIHAAWALTRMSKASRPVGYRDREHVQSSYASRTMRWGGVIILLFIIYHVLHLTTGHAHREFVPDDPYRNVVTGFRIWWVAAVYIVAQLALGLHLYHGVWSLFNSLGLNHARFNPWRRLFATAFALLITVVNISFPVMVMIGIVR